MGTPHTQTVTTQWGENQLLILEVMYKHTQGPRSTRSYQTYNYSYDGLGKG